MCFHRKSSHERYLFIDIRVFNRQNLVGQENTKLKYSGPPASLCHMH